MGELEDQIARLAQHRADQVPAYRAPASLDRARASRRGVWFAVAAAITAVVIAAGAFLWSRGDDPSVRTTPAPATEVPAPTTIPPTTPTTPTTAAPAPATCPGVGNASTSPKSGTGVITPGTALVELAGVNISTSGCTDEVTLTFGRGLPSWSVEYRAGPLTLEPSGLPLEMEGTAFLVVRFEYGQGARSDNGPPKQITAGPLSHITEVRQTQDFEGIVTWVIGLDEQLPFTTTERDESLGGRSLVVAFPERGDPRAVTCSRPQDHLEFTVPLGWYAPLGDDIRCQTVAPPGTDRSVLVYVDPSTSVAALFGPSPVMSSITTADGRTASCLEGTYNSGSSHFPAGQPGFLCSVAWGDGQSLTVTTNGYAGPNYAEYKAGVQAIVASARYVP